MSQGLILKPEVFKKHGAKLSHKFVTITSRGGFLFSAGFIHNENIDKYSHCLIAFDRNAKAIMFAFKNNDEEEGVIKLTHRETGNTSLQAGSFFQYFGLKPENLKGRYELEKKNISRQGEWYVAFLDNKIQRPTNA